MKKILLATAALIASATVASAKCEINHPYNLAVEVSGEGRCFSQEEINFWESRQFRADEIHPEFAMAWFEANDDGPLSRDRIVTLAPNFSELPAHVQALFADIE